MECAKGENDTTTQGSYAKRCEEAYTSSRAQLLSRIGTPLGFPTIIDQRTMDKVQWILKPKHSFGFTKPTDD